MVLDDGDDIKTALSGVIAKLPPDGEPDPDDFADDRVAARLQGLELYKQAKALPKIVDTPSFQAVVELQRQAKAVKKAIEEFFDPIKKAVREGARVTLAHIDKQESSYLEGALKTIEVTDPMILDWDAHMKREKALAEARNAEAVMRGLETGQPVPKPEKVDLPKAEGLSIPSTWTAEVTSFLDLARAVVAGNVPVGAIEPAQKWLDAKAREIRSEDLGIPGVKGVEKRSTRTTV